MSELPQFKFRWMTQRTHVRDITSERNCTTSSDKKVLCLYNGHGLVRHGGEGEPLPFVAMLPVLLTMDAALGLFFLIFCAIPIFVLLFLTLTGCRVVEQETRILVERCGKFHRVCKPGLSYIIPILERTRRIKWRTSYPRIERIGYSGRIRQVAEVQQIDTDRIDLRQNVMDFPSQPIITRDNVEIQVHPMILYKLVNPMRVAYETYDLSHAVEKLVQTNLRSIIGDMGMDDTLASREEINRALKTKIEKICLNWGLAVLAVELLEIVPSHEVQQAMHQQLIAERTRRADIVSADGSRLQKKLTAEGMCERMKALSKGTQRKTEILAKGESDSRKLIADANAKALGLIGDAVAEYGASATHYNMALMYLETLDKICSYAKEREVYFPFDVDIVGGLKNI